MMPTMEAMTEAVKRLLTGLPTDRGLKSESPTLKLQLWTVALSWNQQKLRQRSAPGQLVLGSSIIGAVVQLVL